MNDICQPSEHFATKSVRVWSQCENSSKLFALFTELKALEQSSKMGHWPVWSRTFGCRPTCSTPPGTSASCRPSKLLNSLRRGRYLRTVAAGKRRHIVHSTQKDPNVCSTSMRLEWRGEAITSRSLLLEIGAVSKACRPTGFGHDHGDETIHVSL